VFLDATETVHEWVAVQ